MKIDKSFPPNYDEIKAVFPVDDSKSVVFTYGDTLHNPHGTEIRPDLVVHEAVHARQQTNPKEWWERFLTDADFRLDQELEAYAEQYHFARSILSAEKCKTLLTYLALDLASPGYGCIVDYPKAESLIRHAEHALA